MGLISKLGGGQTTARPPSGGGGFGGFGGFNTFGAQRRLGSAELLELARLQGGTVAQAAESLTHPNTSMLSTASNGFKQLFKGFIKVISTPGNVVAGVLSPDFTVKQAMEQRIDPADVIWGDPDPDNTTSQKVGQFFIRTATDVLLDPLTYLSFGAARGVLGLSSAPRITLGAKAAAKFNLPVSTAKSLSDEGVDVFRYLKNVENQAKGTAKALNIANKTEAHELAGQELKALLNQTIDAPLGTDYSRKAVSNVLEKFPHLTKTLLDKGGIKFFGKSVLSSQRIRSVLDVIPGTSILDKMTKPIRGLVGGLFDPRVVKIGKNNYVRLPEEFLQIEQAGKDLAATFGDSRMIELSNIIRANKLNVNESKLLVAAAEAGKLPSDARLANAYKQLMGFNKRELQFLRHSGVAISRLDNHVPHVLVDTPIQNIPFGRAPSVKVGAKIQRKLEGPIFKIDEEGFRSLETIVEGADEKLIDAAFDDLKQQGFEIFDDNIMTALAKRTLDNTRTGVSRRFIKSVAQSMGELAENAPAGYRAIDSKLLKIEGKKITQVLGRKGEELLYHPAVAKRIEDFISSVLNDDATADLLKNYDKLQNLWKASVTTVFPAFHGRNAISNVFLNFSDIGIHALNPKINAMAGTLLVNDRRINRLQRLALKPGKAGVEAQEQLFDLMSKKVYTDATGHVWSMGELRSAIKNNNVAFNKQLTGALDVVETQEEKLTLLFANNDSFLKKGAKATIPISQQFAPFKFGKEVGRGVEEYSRLVNFLANLNDTGDVLHAAARTKQFLFDYQNLTNFEKIVMRRFIPFYTFTRKNLEVQVKTLFRTPGRSSAQVRFLRNIGDVLSGEELTDEEKSQLPDWMRSGINILKSRKGDNIELLKSLGTPLEQPFEAFQPNQILGSMSPLIRLPMELITGYSFFQGKPLSEVTNAAAFKSAPGFIKDWLGYTDVSFTRKDGTVAEWAVSLRPDRMHALLNLPPTSRVLSLLKQIQTTDISVSAKILQQLIGVRPFSVDLEVEAERRERELRKQLEQILENANLGFNLDRFILQ